jgi:hypothetical protein
MPFQLLPVIDKMIALYEEPISFERFHKYIAIINGDSKSDMEIPIGGYNPMAKSHVLHRLKELKTLRAEEIIADVCSEVNASAKVTALFKVSLTLADDLMGGWTEHYSTDYSSKFKLNAMVKRQFCSVYLYTSEDISPEKITNRTRAYIQRTLHWIDHPKPVTLSDHIIQETAVAKVIKTEQNLSSDAFHKCREVYDIHKDTIEYPIIFSFLFGDKAAKALGYTPLGLSDENAGYRFAQMLD